MISRKLRQAGEQVTHKRVERLYPEAKLQGCRRRRKKIPLAGRQPLVRLQAPNAVWPVQLGLLISSRLGSTSGGVS